MWRLLLFAILPSKWVDRDWPTIEEPLETFASIVERMKVKLQGWKGKLLSQAGKMTIIKSVTAAIQQDLMSCFRLPKHILYDVDKGQKDFIWSNPEGSKNLSKGIWSPAIPLCREWSPYLLRSLFSFSGLQLQGLNNSLPAFFLEYIMVVDLQLNLW